MIRFSLSLQYILALPATPLAALISLQTLEHVLNVLGYPAVTLFILIESMGVPLPGESMLILASFYAGANGQLQLPLVILCAAAGAVIGDNFGYLIGRTGGRAFVERFGRFFFVKMKHLESAERFFERHGGKTVFFGRFVAILRIWAAFLAGMNRMNWRTFLVYNTTGGIIWATLTATLGYLAGSVFHQHIDQVERYSSAFAWIGLGLLVLGLSVTFLTVRLLQKRALRMQNAAVGTDEEK